MCINMSRSDFIRSFGKKFSVAQTIESARTKRAQDTYDRQWEARQHTQRSLRDGQRLQLRNKGNPSGTKRTMPKRSRSLRVAKGASRKYAKSPRGARRKTGVRPRRSLGRRRYLRRGRRTMVRGRGFTRRVKDVVIRHMAPERVWQQQFTDEVSCAGVTNSLSVQNMWAANQNYSVSAANKERFNNLQMFDPQHLWYLLNSVHGNASNARATTKIYVTEYETTGAITNIETAPIELLEYRCVARYDQPYMTTASILLGPPSDANGNGTTTITIDGADKILKYGFKDANYSTSSGMGVSTNYYDYGVTPFDNPAFTRQFKIVKVRKWTLAPGETKHFKYIYRGNRPITMGRILPYLAPGSSNLALDQMRGTGISVFCIRGTIAYNSGADAGYRIGIGNASVGCVYKTRIRYTYQEPNFEQRNIINELPGFANGAGYTPSIPAVRGLMNVNSTGTSVFNVPSAVSGQSDFSGND